LFLALVVLAAIGYVVATLRPDLLPGNLRPTPVQETPSPTAEAPVPEPSRMGEILPYSVLVRAFTSLEAAQEEAVMEQQRLGSVPVFISPEEIQGIVYYKILAGLSTDTLAATRLRERLVEAGTIEPEDATASWSLLQFAPLAFDLGEFASEEEATAWADSLLTREIPAYPVAVPYSDGSQRWQLFGGAYRDSASASSMRQMVQAAGLNPHLTARTGLPATGPQ
jgi:hypothetical protein